MVRSARPPSGTATGPAPGRAAPVHGGQSIHRALQVLRAAASAGGKGARLRDVALACALNKATAHRILAILTEEGFLEFDPETRIYRLGRESYILGWSAGDRFDLRLLAAPSLARICEVTHDTAFLSIRSGHDAVCIDRAVGDFPIKTLTLEIGSRRPLGVGAGSLALLASLPDGEIEESLAASAERLGAFPLLSAPIVRGLVGEARARGYSFNDERVIPGMSAIGVPVIGQGGQVIAALSVAAIASRMNAARREEIAATLREEAVRLAGIVQGRAHQARAHGRVSQGRAAPGQTAKSRAAEGSVDGTRTASGAGRTHSR